ncbi:MAG: SH3 domain-containing protein [Anaerolineae bacterium]|nr:SH3 domain-containing protein [Anaerolineae bacterium]
MQHFRRLVIFAVLIVFLAAIAQPIHAQPAPACDAGTALAPGLWARIANDQPNNLRAAPGLIGERIGSIPSGDIFTILDGPECVDGYRWWQVDYVSEVGWTAEGSIETATFWVEPLNGQDAESLPTPDDPPGCRRPPEDYRLFDFGWATLNLRTLALLDQAQAIYSAGGGSVRFREALVQGSYNAGEVSASFGTHDGGGAVDLSVRSRVNFSVLYDEIMPMLRALRTAGFAAWLRDTDQLYDGSPIHIHAIAIGDADLSEAARAQIDGQYGYFRGFNGLPPDWGGPAPDDVSMVVCSWMRELGFTLSGVN